ncbi:hypothetical protein LCGC14_2792760, partial [marine sediment metagenome]
MSDTPIEFPSLKPEPKPRLKPGPKPGSKRFNFQASPKLTQSQKEELVPKIAQLQAEGYTWKEVGEKLGYHPQRLRKLHLRYPDGQAAGVDEVGIKERSFARKLVKGADKRDAAQEIGKSTRWAIKTMESPNFKSYLFRLLQNAGLTEEFVLEEHKNQIKATRTIVATHKGDITDTMEVPDNAARMTAIRTAHELYGHIGGTAESAGAPSININLTVREKEQIEGLVGRPLNVNVIPVEAIEAPAEPVETVQPGP